MAVQEQVPYVEYVGNGVTKAFPVTFDCEDQKHLIVMIDGVVTLVGQWQLLDERVEFTTPPANQVLITIKRDTPLERTTTYQTYNNSFRPEPVNKDFDRIWWKLQELGLADWLLSKRLDKEIQDRIAADIYYYALITKETDLKLDKLKAYIDQFIKDTNNKIEDLKKYIDALVNNITGENFLPITDRFIETWSGRSQDSKNKDAVSALDFGLIPNSMIDQTKKMDVFLNYLREHNVVGLLPEGTINVSCGKVKEFGRVGEASYEKFNYALDISGVTLIGCMKGYRGKNGTVFRDINQSGVLLFQNQVNAANTYYSISNLCFVNTDTILRMTYALHCEITNLGSDDCNYGVILGEYTFDAGAMCNQFENLNIKSRKKGLQLRGKNWNNANIFKNCFFTGDEESEIHVTGGYGAIDNIFIGGEFNTSPSSKANAIRLRNSKSTTFYSTYFEPRGHTAVLNGARDVNFLNCIFGGTRKNATQSEIPCFVYHESGQVDINISGGSVYLDAQDGLQNDMCLFYSANTSGAKLSIPVNPYVLSSGVTGWRLVRVENLASYLSFSVNHTVDYDIEFSSQGASIKNLGSGSRIRYSLNGSNVDIMITMNITESTILEAGTYYIRNLFTPRDNRVGLVQFTGGQGIQFGNCNQAQGNRNIFIYMKQLISTYNEILKNVTTTETNNIISDTILGDLSRRISSIKANINFQY